MDGVLGIHFFKFHSPVFLPYLWRKSIVSESLGYEK